MLVPSNTNGSCADIKKIVRDNPKSAEAHYYLGCCYLTQERDIQNARLEYEKAISFKKRYPEAFIGIANCYELAEKRLEAISILKEALEILPDEPSLHSRLGFLLESVKKYEEARNHIINALNFEKDPKKAKRLRRLLINLEKLIGTSNCPYCKTNLTLDNIYCPNCYRAIVTCSKCNYPNEIFSSQCLACREALSPYETWMARKNNNRSSCNTLNKPINALKKKWFYPYRNVIKREVLPDIPPPVIAGDIMIVPNPNDLGRIKSFIGIKMNSGEDLLWSWDVGHDLVYSSTPVPVKGSLYIPSHGYLKKRSISATDAQSNIMNAEKKINPHEYCALLPFNNDSSCIAIASTQVLSIYNLFNEQNVIVDIPLFIKEDQVTGVVWNGENVIILSKKGEILSLESDNKIQSLARIKGDVKICSPPCSVDKDIYFEFMYENDKIKRVGVFIQDKRKIIETELEDESDCNPKHSHWKFPPIVFKNGILLASDVYSRVYIAKRDGNHLITVPINLNISEGIVNISQEFSAMIGSYLVSSAGKTFFYVNIDNPEDKGMMNTNSPVIAQPAISQNGLIFILCVNGLHCYEVLN